MRSWKKSLRTVLSGVFAALALAGGVWADDFSENAAQIGAEVSADSGDLLLYVLVAVTGFILIGLAIYVFFRRRK